MVSKIIESTQQRIDSLIAYMKMKIDDKDWHGVADAAMDIRDAEAEILGIRKAEQALGQENES